MGVLFDFAIRHASSNKKSLDDVMRYLYWHYYNELHRRFTDAEFQQACEYIAGNSLTDLFEYVYTTKELDYKTYLFYAGLRQLKQRIQKQEKIFTLSRIKDPTKEQSDILKS